MAPNETSSAALALPSVTIIVVNYDGVDHLGPCLDSIRALDYPSALVTTMLVDNDSHDGSRELLKAQYPWVDVLKQSTNLGFSPAVNLAAQKATTECIALLNNDMRVDPQWLRALVGRYDPAQGFVCVAGAILDWDGTHLDFGDGTINFHGFGQQQGFGRPMTDVVLQDSKVLPFACGGAMLVGREIFNDLGGFDPKFFAYFEDVDFGWRLSVCGYRTRLAAEARSYHRHHGTSSRFAVHERILLLERNSLRSLVKNVSDEHLPRVLAAALLMQAKRSEHDARSDRASYEVGVKADEMEPVHRLATARLHATNDLLRDLPSLMAERSRIQARRQAPDHDVFAGFGQPLEALGNDTPSYRQTLDDVVRFLAIDRLFDRAAGTRFVVLSSSDVIADRMAGTAIRAWEVACALSTHVPTTLASPKPVKRSHPGLDVLHFEDPAELLALVDRADAVLVFGFDLVRYPFLAHTRALVVVDLYDPWIFGSLEQYDTMTKQEADGLQAHEIATLSRLMEVGDFFICASERQRDFWVGMLAAKHRLDKTAHEQDPHLRKLIDVVPFGCPDEPPQRSPKTVLRGPVFGTDDRIILWGGGTWDWFDPLGLLAAFERTVEIVANARLYFMGLELEGRGVPEMAVTTQLKRRVEELGWLGTKVVFGPWVPYDDRGAYLLEADVGVVAAKAMAESRLAWRTRMLDHFWAGLPTVATEGDVLAELMASEGAGLSVTPNDVDAMAAALVRMLTDDEFRLRCGRRSSALAEQFRWSEVVGPLAAMARDPWPWRAARAQRGRTVGGGGTLGAEHPEIHRLAAELAETQRHLGAARKKLDVLNKTPIYPIYKKLQAARARLRGGV